MNEFYNIMYYVSYVVDFCCASILFFCGGLLIYRLEEVSVGKELSRLLAMIVAILSFYNISEVPLVGRYIPGFSISNDIARYSFYLILGSFFMIQLGAFIYNIKEEIRRIMNDVNVLPICISFAISGFLFSTIF